MRTAGLVGLLPVVVGCVPVASGVIGGIAGSMVAQHVVSSMRDSQRVSAPIRLQDYAFVEVSSLGRLPSAIRSELEASTSGPDGIADREEPFNAGCVIDGGMPTHRFLVAGADGDTWLVAIERGGRAYNVEATLFWRATPQKKWVLLGTPRTLREVVQQVSQQEGR